MEGMVTSDRAGNEMRLTTTMKEEAVKNLVDDLLPTIDYPNEMARARYMELLPDKVREAWGMFPRYFSTSSYLSMVKKSARKKENPRWDDYFTFDTDDFPSEYNDSIPYDEEINSLCVQSKKRAEARKALKEKLTMALKSISTLGKVKQYLPELVPYFPSSEVKSLVPVEFYENIRKELHGLRS